jgi:integrase
VPLSALFTGLRLEEIARLRPGLDFRIRPKSPNSDRKYGIAYVTVQAHDGWKPKTPRAKREVPIHEWLLDYGFDDLFRKRMQELEDPVNRKHSIYLFPELQRGKNGSYTAGFSREFSRLKKKLGFRPELTFHSFRHTFRSQLGNAKVREEMIDDLLGHEDGQRKIQKLYQEYSLTELDEAVQSFVLPVEQDGVLMQHAQLSDTADDLKPTYLDFLLPDRPEKIGSPPISDSSFWADAENAAKATP